MKNAARRFYKSNDEAQEARPLFRLRPIAYCVMIACCDLAAANPNGPVVVNGSVQFQGLGTNNLSITNTPGAIINWQGFSIGAGQLTQFIQQNAASSVLNRVVGGNISQIQGQLSSNGRVFLINPAGIIIGAGAVIDTAGFVGSTLNMLDADFLRGKLSFQGDANSGSIINQGFIKTTHGGDIVLVAPNIENSGIIQADGKLLLAAGQKLTIGSLDANDVQFEVQAPSDSVLNIGQLLSNGGAAGVFAGTLRHTGDIRATSMSMEGGRVVLKSQGDTILAGNSTTVATGDKGGTVQVLGERVGVLDNSKIETSGEHGGGTILIGGDYRGLNPLVQNAKATFIGGDATLTANATRDGDGGRLIVWSDDSTRVYGSLSAVGAGSGKGGFVETSGHFLDVGGLGPDVGAGGTWLLDPFNITVTAATTTNNTGTPNFTPNGNNSQVSAAQINTRLNGGSSVTLSTTGVGTQAGDINVNAAITKSVAGGTPTLTLQADGAIAVNQPISSTSGNLSVAMTAGGSINVNAAITKANAGGTVTLSAGNAITVNAPMTTRSQVTMTAGTAAGAAGGITLNEPVTADTGSNGDPGMSFTTNVGNIVINTPTGAVPSLSAQGDTIGNPIVLTATNGALVNNSTTTAPSGGVIHNAALTVQAAQGMTGSAVPTLLTDRVRTVAVTAGAGDFAMANSSSGLQVNTSSAGASRRLSFTATGQTISTGGAITVGSGGTVSLTGSTVTVNNAVSAASGGTVSLFGDNVTISNAITATNGIVNIAPSTAGIAIRVGGADTTASPGPAVLGVDQAELNLLTASTVRIGNSGAGPLAVSGPVTIAAASIPKLSLQSGGAVTQQPAPGPAGGPPAGTINVSQLEVSGTSVNLPENNIVATLAGQSTTGDFTFVDARPAGMTVGSVLDFNKITSSGNVTLTATSMGISAPITASTAAGTVALTTTAGDITQAGAASAISANTLQLTTTNSNATLNSSTNQITNLGATALGTGSLNLLDAGGLTVTGAVDAGNVTISTSGALVLNGNITSLADVSLTTTAPGAVPPAPTITQNGNGIINAGGTLNLNTANADVTLTSVSGRGTTNDVVTLGRSALGTGILSYRDTGGLRVFDGGAGATGVTANGITLTTSGAIVVDSPLNAGGGNVSLTSTGAGSAITQSAPGVITADTLTLTTNNANATLHVASNALTNLGATALGTGRLDLLDVGGLTVNGAVGASGGIALNTSGALALNNGLNAGTGNISLTTTGGSSSAITQPAGAITAATLNVTTTNANATLTNGGNAVTNLGAVALGTGAFSFVNAAGLNLTAGVTATGGVTLNTGGALSIDGAITAGSGAISVTAAGAITQSAPISGGASSFTATGGAGVTLNTGSNDFTGPVAISSAGGAVTIRDANALTLGTVNTGGGALNITAGGAITQSTGTAIAAGAANINAGGNSITLDSTNDFTGAVTFTNLTATPADVRITDTTALTIAAPVGPIRNFIASAGGALTLPTLTTSGSQFLSGSSITLGGDLTTTNSVIDITGPVILPASRILSSGSGQIRFVSIGLFNSSINAAAPGGAALTLNSSNTTSLAGPVGNTNALSAFTKNAGGGSIVINGNVTTTGAQSFGDSVLITSDVTFSSAGGAVTFSSPVNGGNALTVSTAGTTSFLAGAGGATPLASLTTSNAAGTTSLAGSITTSGAQSYAGPVSLAGSATLTGTTPTFGGNVTGNGNDLTLNFSGTTTIGSTFTSIRNLTTGNGGTTSITGNIATSGTQTYGDSVTLGGSLPITLSSTGAGPAGNIAFNNTLNGNGLNVPLTINTAGATTFGGIVGAGTPVTSITTDAAGTTTIGAAITTTVAQTFNDPVTLTGAVTLTSGAGGVAFNNTLDGAQTLAVNTAGVTTFNAVGSTTALTSITTDAAGSTSLGGTLTTTGAQTYNDPVTLRANTAVVSTGAGNVTFGGTINGANALTVTTGGTTTFSAGVGGGAPLTSLTTDAAGITAINGGAINTTGAQTYGDAVTLGAATTLTSTVGGNLVFGSTVQSPGTPRALTLATAGTTTLGGFVGGGGNPLLSLTTDATGTTQINGGGVTTTTTQTYNDAVTLGANATLTGTTGTFPAGLNGGGFDLALDFSGVTTLDATFANIRNLSTGNGGTTLLNGVITTSGSQTYGDAVTLGTAATTAASTGNGAITFNNTVDGASDLTVNTGGTTTFAAAVGNGVALTSLTTDAVGSTAISGGAIRTTGAQTYGDAVTLGADATLTSTALGTIAFSNTLTSPGTARSLTVNSSGVTRFTGAVGGGGSPLLSLTTDAGGSTAINGGAVTTTGAQTYNDPVVIGAAATFASTSAGAVTFANTLNGGADVTVNTAGTTTFAGIVGGATALTSLATDAAGTTAINGGSITTTAAQSYGDPVTLGGATTLTSTGGGNIVLSGTVQSPGTARALTVATAGTTTFGSLVGGGGNPLLSVTTDAAGTTQINGGGVTTTAGQIYNDAVTLGANATLTGTSGTFPGGLNGGGFDLALNFTAATTLDGAFANIHNLSTGSAGTTTLNGVVTTTGSQTYGNPVTLGTAATTTTSTGGGAITFNSTVDGASDLTVNTTGTTTFTAAVGAGAALTSLTTNAGGSTVLNGGAVTTTGGQTYGDALLLGANTTLASTGGGTLAFAALDSSGTARSLNANTIGVTRFAGAVGAGTPLLSLTTDVGGTTAINGGGITTTGAQTYNDAVLVNAAATLSSTGGGAINFVTTVNGPAALTVNTGGTTTFGSTVGATTALASLTTDAAGATQINGGAITTSASQNYGDAVTLGAATTLTSTAGGNIAFGGTLNGPFALTANSSGATSFGGVVGGTTPLTSITTDLPGTTSITGGSIRTSGAQVYNDAVTANAVTLTSTGGGNLTATNGANDFTAAASFNTSGTGTVNIIDVNALALGASTLGTGALTVTAVGITQTGPITQGAGGGAATFNGGAGPITLTQANAFTGPVALNNTGANNVALTNTGALQLGASAVGSGTLAVNAGGPITQGGAITQQAGATGASFNAGANPITLGNAGNDFTGPVSLTTTGGNAVAIRDSNTLVLGTSSLPAATFDVTAGGVITQSGGGITAGTLTLTTTSANATLNNAGNAIGNLGTSNLGTGSLNLSNTGPLNVTGVVTAGGATIATTGALTDSAGAAIVTSNGPIALTGTAIGTAANTFSVNPGTGTVTATASTGSVFLDQAAGDVVTSRYTVNAPAGQTIGLASAAGGITADASVSAPGRNVVLTTQSAGNSFVIGNGVTVDAASLALSSPGAATLSIADSNVTFNTPVTTGATVTTTISGTSVVTNNGAMTLNGPLSWSGTGTLGGTGTVTVGTLNMVGASPHLGTTLTTTTYNQGPGGLTIDNNGVLNLTNAGSATINGTALVNSGRLNVGGPGSVLIRNNGALINANLLDVQGDVSFDSNTPASPGVLINAAAGTLQKSAGGGTTALGATGALTFTNAGTLSAQTGTIEYRQNANTFNNGTQFTGRGTHLITGSSTFNGTASNAGTLTINGGTQTIAGTLANNAGATLNVGASAGNFAGTGMLTNAGTLTSAGTHQLGSASFANTGTVSVTGGTLTIAGNDVDGSGAGGDSGTYTVAGGATLGFADSARDFLAPSLIGGAGNVSFAGPTVASTFNVRGPYSPGGTTSISPGATVNFFGATTMPSLSMTGGALGVGAGGTLNLTGAGATTITGGTLTNFGTLTVSGGTAQVNGAFPVNDGTLRVGPGATLATTANLTNASTGLIGGNGTISLGGGANTLTNNGTVSPGASPGTLAITGNYTQGPAGTMLIELGGTNPGVTYDLLQVSGTATLGGTLTANLVNGFVPSGGNRFDFMTFANRVGDFGTFVLPSAAALAPQPGAASYALVAAVLPQDLSGELRRLYDDLQRLAETDTVEEPRFRGGKQICE